jgi:hypothetical protein
MRHRMLSVGLFPALSLIVGAVLALAFNLSPNWGLWLLLAASSGALPAWWWRARATTIVMLAVGFFSAGALLTADARERALHSSLRAALDAEFGNFLIETLGPEARNRRYRCALCSSRTRPFARRMCRCARV